MTLKKWFKIWNNANRKIHGEIVGMDIVNPEVRWRFLTWWHEALEQPSNGKSGQMGTGLWDGAWPGIREVIQCRPQGRGASIF